MAKTSPHATLILIITLAGIPIGIQESQLGLTSPHFQGSSRASSARPSPPPRCRPPCRGCRAAWTKKTGTKRPGWRAGRSRLPDGPGGFGVASATRRFRAEARLLRCATVPPTRAGRCWSSVPVEDAPVTTRGGGVGRPWADHDVPLEPHSIARPARFAPGSSRGCVRAYRDIIAHAAPSL